MPSKLGLYNQALLELGHPKLKTVTDNIESRRILDTVWDNRAIQAVLERAYWKFSLRSVALVNDENFTPAFGYRFVFTLPTDYLRTYMLCSDPFYANPLGNYQLEGTQIYAERDQIYLRYVSKENGENMDGWPAQFEQAVVTYLAMRGARKITSSTKAEERADKGYDKALKTAMNLDVIENPPEIRQEGRWRQARGRHHYRYGKD